MNGINGVSDMEEMRIKVREQGDIVRNLKANKATEYELKEALSLLKMYKKALEAKELELRPNDYKFDRNKLEDLLKQRFFYDQSFSIYGGVQGLYDYGPMGCAMKANLLSIWRNFFILEEHLLEVECSILTPERVLQASGHVERFTDLMVKDIKTGECFRADHLVKSALESRQNVKNVTAEEKNEIEHVLIQLDNYGASELSDLIKKYGIKSPITKNDLSEPQSFNLMFSTSIGPTGQYKGYLRPETAQGIFVNFQRLLEFNQGRLPFGAAQIGPAYRNEISPRSGLIRVREFTMAEIEYFVDPTNKDHPKFDEVRETEILLFSVCDQMAGKSPVMKTIGKAVDEGTVANQTLGYFMARIYLFLMYIGLDPKRVRFRQHLLNEMAHYACDCWDAECLTSYGWIECVGCADRSCYDLSQHTKFTGANLVAKMRLDRPRTVRTLQSFPNKCNMGKTYRNDVKDITQQLSSLSIDDLNLFKKQLDETGKMLLSVRGKQFELDRSMVDIRETESVTHVEEIVPNVIEPSFGIGRVLYSLFEHSFRVRDEDEQRTYLAVPPALAPFKCSLLPLSNNAEFSRLLRQLSVELTRSNVSHRIDEGSGSIGRRYARTDQIAIPYGITIDFDTINKQPSSATLRERDSMKQIRVPLTELPALVLNLTNGIVTWTEAQAKYPIFEQQETASVRNTEFELQTTSSVSCEQDSNYVKHVPLSKPKSSKSATRQHFNADDKCNTRKLHQQANNHPNRVGVKYDDSNTLSQSSVTSGIMNNDHKQEENSLNSLILRGSSGYEADHEEEDSITTDRSAISTLSQRNNQVCVTAIVQTDTHSQEVDSDKQQPFSVQSSKIPYHGLFVGDNWPSCPMKESTKQKQQKSKATNNNTPVDCRTDDIKDGEISVMSSSPVVSLTPMPNNDWKWFLAQSGNLNLTNEMSHFMNSLIVKPSTEIVKDSPFVDDQVVNGSPVQTKGEQTATDWSLSQSKQLTDSIKFDANNSWVSVISHIPESCAIVDQLHLSDAALSALAETHSTPPPPPPDDSTSPLSNIVADVDDKLSMPCVPVEPIDSTSTVVQSAINNDAKSTDSKVTSKPDGMHAKKRRKKAKGKKK